VATDTTLVSTATEELLTGLATEEVEPGVYRVVNDGVRDLASMNNRDIVAGHDGGIWLLQDDEFLRLGSGETHLWPADTAPEDHILEVAPDGTMWVIPRWYEWDPDLRDGGLRSTDGDEWTVQSCTSGEDCWGMTVAPDGTVWRPFDERMWMRLFFTEAGGLYGVWCYGDCFLIPYEDGDDLARFAEGVTDDEWAPLTSADLPDIRYGLGLDHPFEITPDDGLWASLWRSPDGGDPRDGDGSISESLLSAVEDGRLVCDGVAHFDGETLDRFLPGRCITMDIAADGSVWVLADEESGKDLYVITPEAVAASE
jgi:hypothetical protein